MSNKINPKVTLVGAGPGDVELITFKGIKALEQADVILYDALVSPQILDFAPEEAIRVYVGKRDNQHTYTQEQINYLIVSLAYTHGHVVRLKGGDPFVFGRGQEELEYAESFNIDTEYIPGISSSISVPGLSGIPVTHRGATESFWVITGTTQKGELSEDVRHAAKTNATIVILMGLKRLKEIVEVFEKAGKKNAAVAIIQDGSLPSQKVALGTISSILEIAHSAQIKAPATIVIGEVVKLHRQYPHIISELKHLVN